MQFSFFVERNSLYTFKVYPEHLGECPLDTINDCLDGYAYAVSPIHNLDYRSDGALKKEHYHINIRFRSPITHNSCVMKLCNAFKNCGGDIVGNFSADDSVQAARGKQRFLDRYLIHLDHPEKHLYSRDDIYVSLGYKLDLSENDVSVENDVISLIFDMKVSTLNELITYLRNNQKYDELHFVVKNTYFVKSLF